jgi:hypothetical protein
MSLLALILVLIVVTVIRRWLQRGPAPPPTDLSVPYREGLHTAMHMHTFAQELEQELYAEAIRQAESDLPIDRVAQDGEQP